VQNVSEEKNSYQKRSKMNSRTITLDISSGNILSQLEPLLRALRVLSNDEEIIDIKIGKYENAVPITFTITKGAETLQVISHN
jgi:hypothetical protein